MPFDFAETQKLWEAIPASTSPVGIPVKAFLDASDEVCKIFDSIKGMSAPKGDIEGNVNKIRKNITDPEATLFTMIEAEAKPTKEGCTGLALLWLKRALYLVEGIMAEFCKDAEAKFKDVVNAAYAGSLKKYHGMVIKGVFSAAMSMCPSRESFLESLGTDNATAIENMKKIQPHFKKILDNIDEYLKSKKIEDK